MHDGPLTGGPWLRAFCTDGVVVLCIRISALVKLHLVSIHTGRSVSSWWTHSGDACINLKRPWPSRSPDLISPDFFPFGHTVVYSNKPRPIDDLKIPSSKLQPLRLCYNVCWPVWNIASRTVTMETASCLLGDGMQFYKDWSMYLYHLVTISKLMVVWKPCLVGCCAVLSRRYWPTF
jgi:hypothetical protein